MLYHEMLFIWEESPSRTFLILKSTSFLFVTCNVTLKLLAISIAKSELVSQVGKISKIYFNPFQKDSNEQLIQTIFLLSF